jgi:putative flippase GtrA
MQHSFVRFLFVGVINTIVGLSMMYVLLNGFGLSYWVSTFLGNMVGAGVSYFLNKKFTFKSNAPVSGSLLRFILVIGVCYFISYFLGIRLAGWILNQLFSLPNTLQKELGVLIGTGLYTILNYLGQKVFVFKEKTATSQN